MGMRSRRFGIEIECNFQHADGPGNYLGDQRQRERAVSLMSGLISRGFIGAGWVDDVGFDGSGIEVRSPILGGKRGFQELEAVMTTFTENGGEATDADGMHIHHDSPEYVHSVELCARIVKSWKANEEFIESFVHPSRHNSWACPRDWSDPMIEMLEGKRSRYYGDTTDRDGRVISPCSRGALNLSSLREHGSIEIRLHQGTLDYSEAAAWIRFGQAFIDAVAKRKTPMRKVTGNAQLLKSIRIAKVPYDVLLEKATNPKPITEYNDSDGEYYDEYEEEESEEMSYA